MADARSGPRADAADGDVRALVARVTEQVVARAGKRRPELAEVVAAEVAAALERQGRTAGGAAPAAAKRSQRAVVTTTGKNARGIVAKIAQAIADAGGDILDISQTLVSDYFTMIIIVDTRALEVPFADFKARLQAAVGALGAECLVMHEDVVNALQRV